MEVLQTIDQEVLSQVPTKNQVANATQSIIAFVEEGMVNPLQALASLTAFEKTFTDAKKAIQEFALNEAAKYQEKSIKLNGAQFTLKETGVKYDYTADQQWRTINEKIDELKAELKGRETTLKQLGQYIKSSSTTISVTLPE